MALNRRQKIRLGVIYPITLFIASCCFFAPPMILHLGFTQLLYLGPSWPAYEFWSDIPLDIPIEMTLFNITNHKEFLHKGCKPEFEEIGPFHFTYRMKKVNVLWDEVAGTVKFHYFRNFTFHPEKSFGNENDHIIIPNLTLISALVVGPRMGHTMITFGVYVLSYIMEGQTFVKTTIKDFLISGSFDLFADFGEPILQTGQIHDGKIGLIPLLNGTDPIELTISAKGHNTGQLIEWDHKKNFGFYSDPECDRVRGADVPILPMPITKESIFDVYAPEVHLVAPIEYYGEGIVGGVIHTYEFIAKKTIWLSPRVHPPNKCRCVYDDGCPDSGMIDLAPSMWGAPAVITRPYFNRTEKHLYQKVIFKNRKEHPRFSIVRVDPFSGFIVGGTLSAQISLKFHGLKKFGGLGKVPEMLYPIAIAKEDLSAGGDLTTLYWVLVVLPVILSYVFGSLLLVALAYLTYRVFKHNACAGKPETTVSKDLTRQYAAEKSLNI